MSYLAERGLENGEARSEGEGVGKEVFQVERIGYETTQGSHLLALQPLMHVLKVYYFEIFTHFTHNSS